MIDDSKLEPQFAYFGNITPKEIEDSFLVTFDSRAERNGDHWRLQFSDRSLISITQREGAFDTFQRYFKRIEDPTILFGLEEMCSDELTRLSSQLEATKELEFWFEFSCDCHAAYYEIEVLLEYLLDATSGFAYKIGQARGFCSTVGSRYVPTR